VAVQVPLAEALMVQYLYRLVVWAAQVFAQLLLDKECFMLAVAVAVSMLITLIQKHLLLVAVVETVDVTLTDLPV
jgi:hypothetical protein